MGARNDYTKYLHPIVLKQFVSDWEFPCPDDEIFTDIMHVGCSYQNASNRIQEYKKILDEASSMGQMKLDSTVNTSPLLTENDGEIHLFGKSSSKQISMLYNFLSDKSIFVGPQKSQLSSTEILKSYFESGAQRAQRIRDQCDPKEVSFHKALDFFFRDVKIKPYCSSSEGMLWFRDKALLSHKICNLTPDVAHKMSMNQGMDDLVEVWPMIHDNEIKKDMNDIIGYDDQVRLWVSMRQESPESLLKWTYYSTDSAEISCDINLSQITSIRKVHEKFTRLLNSLSLSPEHCLELKNRGLKVAQIK